MFCLDLPRPCAKCVCIISAKFCDVLRAEFVFVYVYVCVCNINTEKDIEQRIKSELLAR